MSGVAPPRQEVSCGIVLGVWWKYIEAMCVFQCCQGCVALVVVFVDFSGFPLVSQKFIENGYPLGTGLCCCGCVLTLPSDLASGLLGALSGSSASHDLYQAGT